MSNPPDLRNSLVVTRGQKNNLALAVWDAVGVCTGNEDSDEDKCPLHLDCPYLVATNPTLLTLSSGGRTDPDKCVLQAKYLDYIYKSLVLDTAKNLDQHQVDSIGLHLVPLYGHLIKFKMVEFTLNNVLVGGSKGAKSIHPIYKEIRETIKAISFLWREIGLRSPLPLPPTGFDLDSMLQNGDPGYYDELCESERSSTLPPAVISEKKEKTRAQIKYQSSDKFRHKKLLSPKEKRQLGQDEYYQRENEKKYDKEYNRRQYLKTKEPEPLTPEQELEAFDREMEQRAKHKEKDTDKGTTKLLNRVVEEDVRPRETNKMIRHAEQYVVDYRRNKRIPIPTK